MRQRGDVAVERAQLHRQRDAHAVAHLADQLHSRLVNVGAGQTSIGRHEVDVQLQHIGSSFLDQAGVLDPTANRDTIQAADDRDPHGCLTAPHVVEVTMAGQFR